MPHRNAETALLAAEIELLMQERKALLQIAGAAAAFVAELDSETLPTDTLEAAEWLAASLNAIPESLLQESLQQLQAHMLQEEKTAVV